MLDFQERTDSHADIRWVDRLTLDGTWSGNVFDFFGLTIPRLSRDLRVPFQLRGYTRIDDTPVHKALREALVNTLIHADYTAEISLLVVKRSDLFAFRNPGAMRILAETALRGGVSDCRNRRLQNMFRYVGLGEQAGSGMAKIQAAWRAQHWRSPEMVEEVVPHELTLFTLRMASLLPAEVVQALEQRFGADLTRHQRSKAGAGDRRRRTLGHPCPLAHDDRRPSTGRELGPVVIGAAGHAPIWRSPQANVLFFTGRTSGGRGHIRQFRAAAYGGIGHVWAGGRAQGELRAQRRDLGA